MVAASVGELGNTRTAGEYPYNWGIPVQLGNTRTTGEYPYSWGIPVQLGNTRTAGEYPYNCMTFSVASQQTWVLRVTAGTTCNLTEVDL